MRHAFFVVRPHTTAPRCKEGAGRMQTVRLHLQHKQDTQIAQVVKKVNEMTTDKQKETAKKTSGKQNRDGRK